ncbi:hypothetical protein LSAT2_032212 [Lamellibrachia satsuma]|nr:hypothetical protein LSAT2_032212 [Lamellibrachia satsuma]
MRSIALSPLTQSIEQLKEVVLGNGSRSPEYTTRSKLEQINVLHGLSPATQIMTRKRCVKFSDAVQVNDDSSYTTGDFSTFKTPVYSPCLQNTAFLTCNDTDPYKNRRIYGDVNMNNTYKYTRINAINEKPRWPPPYGTAIGEKMTELGGRDEQWKATRRERPLKELPKRGVVRGVGEDTRPPPGVVRGVGEDTRPTFASPPKTLPLRSIMRRITESPKPRKLTSPRKLWSPKLWPSRGNIRAKRDIQSTNYKRCISRYIDNMATDRVRGGSTSEVNSIHFSDCISEEDDEDETEEDSDAKSHSNTYKLNVTDDGSENTSNSNQSETSSISSRGGARRRPVSRRLGVDHVNALTGGTPSSREDTVQRRTVLGSCMQKGLSLNQDIYRDVPRRGEVRYAQDKVESRRGEVSYALYKDEPRRGKVRYARDKDESRRGEVRYALDKDEPRHGEVRSVVNAQKPLKNLSQRWHRPRRRAHESPGSSYDTYPSDCTLSDDDYTNIAASIPCSPPVRQHHNSGLMSVSPSDDLFTLQRASKKFLQDESFNEHRPMVGCVSSLDRVYGSLEQLTTYCEAIKSYDQVDTDVSKTESDATTSMVNACLSNAAGVRRPATARDTGATTMVLARSPDGNDDGRSRSQSASPSSRQPSHSTPDDDGFSYTNSTQRTYVLSSESDESVLDDRCADYVEGIPHVSESDTFDVDDMITYETIPMADPGFKCIDKHYAVMNNENRAPTNNENVTSMNNKSMAPLRMRIASPRHRMAHDVNTTRRRSNSPTKAPEYPLNSGFNGADHSDASTKSNGNSRPAHPNRQASVVITRGARPVYGKYSFSHVLCETRPRTDSGLNRQSSDERCGSSRVISYHVPYKARSTDVKPRNQPGTCHAPESRRVSVQKTQQPGDANTTTCRRASPQPGGGGGETIHMAVNCQSPTRQIALQSSPRVRSSAEKPATPVTRRPSRSPNDHDTAIANTTVTYMSSSTGPDVPTSSHHVTSRTSQVAHKNTLRPSRFWHVEIPPTNEACAEDQSVTQSADSRPGMGCGDTSDAPTDTAGVSDDSLKDQFTAIKSPQEIVTVLRCESNITETATPPQSTSTETYSEKKELRRNHCREKAPRVARGAAIGSNRKDAVGCSDLLRDAASAANETKTTQAGSNLTHQKHNSSQTRPSSHDLGVNAVCKHESQSSQTVQSPINTSTNMVSGHSPRTVPSPNELETKRQATSSSSANKDRFVSAPQAINSTMKAESDDSSKITKPAITQKVDQRPLIVLPQGNPFTNAEHSHESVIVNIPPEVYSGTNTEHSLHTIPSTVYSGTNTDHSRQTIPHPVYSGTNTENMPQTIPSSVYPCTNIEHSRQTIPSSVYPGTNTQNSRQTIPSTVYSGTNTDHSRQTIPHPVYSGTNTDHSRQTIPHTVYSGTNTQNSRQTIPSSVYPCTNIEHSRQTIPSSVYPGTNTENMPQTIPSSVYPCTNIEHSRQTIPSSVYPGTNTENCRQTIPSSVYPGTNTENSRQTMLSSVYPGTNMENCRQTIPSSVYPGTNTENSRQTIPSSVYPGTNTENSRQTMQSSVYPGTNTKKGRHTIPSSVYQSTNTENIVQTIPSLVYPGVNKENSRQTIPYVFYSGTNTDHGRQIVLPMVYSSTNTEPSRQTIPPVVYSVTNTEPSRQTTQPVVYSGTNTDHGRQIIPPVDYSGTNTERGHESQTEQSSNPSIESKTNSRQLPETAAVQTECCEAARQRPTTRIPRQTWHSPVKKHTARNTTLLNNGIRLTPSGSTSVSDGQTQTNHRRRWKESDAKLALVSIENRYAPAQNKKHECRAFVNRKHGESLPCDANERMSRIPIRKTQIRPAIGSRRTTSSTDGLTKSDKTMQVNKLGASSRLRSQRASSVPSASNTTLQDTSASVSQVCSCDASVDEWHVAAPAKVQPAKGSYLPMQSESDNSLVSRSRRILPIPRFSGSEIAIRLKTDRGINVHWELGCRALQTRKSSEKDQMFSLQGDSTYIQHKTKNEAQNTQTSSGQDQLCEDRHYSQSETTVSSKSEGEIVSKKSGVNTMTVLRTSGVDASNSLQKSDESSTIQQVSFVKVGMVSVSAKADRFQTVRWKTDNYDHNGRQCKPVQTSESETLVSSKPKPDVVQRRRQMRKSMDDAFVVKRSGDGVSVGKKCNSDAVGGWLPSQSQKSSQYKSKPDYDFQRRTGSEDGNVYNSYDEPVVEDTSVEGSPESRTPEINADRRLSIKDNKIQQLYEKNSSIRASSEEDSRMRERSRTASSSTRKPEVDDKGRRNSGMEGASRQRENNACVGRRKSEEHSRLYHPPENKTVTI